MAKAPRTTAGSLSTQPAWFDKLSDLRKDSICILLLYVIIIVLCNKIVFGDMIFAGSESGDTISHQSFVRSMDFLKNKQHTDPLWIPYIFSGMPIFGTMIFPRNMDYVEITLSAIGRVIFFGSEVSWILMHFFLNGLFMFLLARSLKFSQLPSLLAALTFMLNPYAIELAEAGHGSQLMTLSYLPLALLFTVRLLERRDLLSLGLLSIVSATMLLASHVQMAFYGFMLIGLYLLYEIIMNVRTQPVAVMKGILMFVVAITVGFIISSYVYLPTQEYARYSIRGGGEGNVLAGLNFDYATQWSFHPMEMFNYLIPATFGFSSQYVTDWQGTQMPLPLYWGWMPFTTSTVYIGIVPILLAIIALIYRRTRFTIFLAIITAFFFLLAFGKFSPFVYDLMFNYFPFFNKFRVPVMILQVVPLTLGLLAAYGMTVLLELPAHQKEINITALRKRLTIVAIVIASVLVLGTIARSGVYGFLSDFMFKKAGETKQYGQEVVTALGEKRFDVFWGGFLKFAVFSCTILAAIILYLKGKIQRFSMAAACIIVLGIDLLLLDGYYINPKLKTDLEQAFVSDAATQRLQAESDTSIFRVYPVETFESNIMMAQHVQSIGGYSPAKLKIYQEMRDSCRLDEGNLNVVSMLNVKYFYRTQKTKDGGSESVLQPNPNFLPRAWFVNEVRVYAGKHEIFQQMNLPTFDPRQFALLEKQPAEPVMKPDTASAAIASYTSDAIELDAATDKTALLVVSEMYYPAGWTATVDGKETEIYKTNYILRSVIVPPGKHRISFRFEPKMYERGFAVSAAGWGIASLFLLIGFAPEIKRRMTRNPVDPRQS